MKTLDAAQRLHPQIGPGPQLFVIRVRCRTPGPIPRKTSNTSVRVYDLADKIGIGPLTFCDNRNTVRPGSGVAMTYPPCEFGHVRIVRNTLPLNDNIVIAKAMEFAERD